MSRAATACILLVILGVFGAIIVSSPRRARDGDRIGSEGEQGRGRMENGLELKPSALVRLPTFADSEVPGQLGVILSDYWGSDWPEVQRIAEEKGIDLSAPFRLQPWSEVQESLRGEFVQFTEERKLAVLQNHIRYPDELTEEWLSEHYELPDWFDSRALSEVDAIAATFNRDMEVIGITYADHIQFALEDAWTRGDYLGVPFSTDLVPAQDHKHGHSFYSRAIASGSGWCVSVALKAEDHPYLVSMRDQLRSLRKERNARINRYFSNSR
jgi:hypothetical protein